MHTIIEQAEPGIHLSPGIGDGPLKGQQMNILTFSEARAGLKAAMDEVCADHSPTVITRQNGDPVVMMSLADFNSIEETLYLLSSPKNASRLLASFEQLKSGKVRIRELDRNEESKI
jgi:antitoxin YefM